MGLACAQADVPMEWVLQLQPPHGQYVPYPEFVQRELEAHYLRGDESLPIDGNSQRSPGGRFVVRLRLNPMRQEREGNPEQWVPVRRQVRTPPRYPHSEVFDACCSGNLQRLRELIEQHPDDWLSTGRHEQRHTSAGQSNYDVYRDRKNRTPLHYASRFGHVDCVTLLVEARAHVDAMEQFGATPLFFACQAAGCGGGQLECAKLLITHGAKPYETRINKRCEDRGTDPLEFFDDGETCLLAAYRAAHPELVRLLFSHLPPSSSSSAYEQLTDGSSPVHVLCNPSRMNLQCPSPGPEQCLELFLSNHLSWCSRHELQMDRKSVYAVNELDCDGNTPLHLACRNTVRPGLISSLLNARASVHTGDERMDTPLHVAITTYCAEAPTVVKLLLDAGSDLLYKSRGSNALETAISLRDHGDLTQGNIMVELLREPTAKATAALAESRRAEKMLEAARRREEQARQAAAAAAEQEREEQERAAALAAQKARREAEAAALEEQRRALASETAAKLAAERAAAEASLAAQREEAARAEAAERAESQRALAERKAAEASHAQRAEEAARVRAAEEEAKRRAKLKEAADAKKAAKQEKKERRKAPSAFKLQQEQEERAREEQRAEEQRAMELAAARAREERQRDAREAQRDALLAHSERRAAELREAELAAELEDAISGVRDIELALATRPSAQEEAAPDAGPSEPAAAAPAQHPGADEAALCVVCVEQARTHMVFPCGHRCLCEGCSERVAAAPACPMCRGPIVGICKVFL